MLIYSALLVAPEINDASIDRTVNEGQLVVLYCNASGCPTPDFTWRKAGSPRFSETGNSVTFSSIASSDHGEYVCNATAKGQSATKSGMLIVQCK